MENLSLLELAAAGLVVMVAFGVRGTAGFGGQAIAVPLLTLMLPLPVVVPAMTALVVLSSLAHWLRDWRSIVWREIARLAPFTLAGVLIGLYVFQVADPRALTRAFGAFVILYAGFTLITAARALPIPKGYLWPFGALLSTTAGVVGTVFGSAAGPLYVIYLNALRLDKDSFRVTITTVLLFQALMRVAGYAPLGFYDRATLLLAAAALPMMLIGTRIGNLLAGRVEQHVFNVSVALVLMVSGTALLLK